MGYFDTFLFLRRSSKDFLCLRYAFTLLVNGRRIHGFHGVDCLVELEMDRVKLLIVVESSRSDWERSGGTIGGLAFFDGYVYT